MPDAHAYGDLIATALAPGFSIGELVRIGSPRLVLPPERYWGRIVDTLILANELRARMKALGAKGLRVNAAFRPDGGAPNSQHKHNRALDLDLLQGDDGLADEYYVQATKLWCERGAELDVGLGLYCARGRLSGIRVHIDTHYRCRTWQHAGNNPVNPPAARLIAKREGFDLPNDTDDHT